MSEGVAWIAAGWLLAYAGFNGALFVSFRKRTRSERRFLKESDGADVDPIQAAWWLGASWENAPAQQEWYAAEVAVRLLITAGDAEGRQGRPGHPDTRAVPITRGPGSRGTRGRPAPARERHGPRAPH